MALSCATTACSVMLGGVAGDAGEPVVERRRAGPRAWLATAPVSSARPPCSLIASSGSGLAATVCSTFESAVSAATTSSSAGGAPSTSATAALERLEVVGTSWPLVSSGGAAAGGHELRALLGELAELAELAEDLGERPWAAAAAASPASGGPGEVGLGDHGGQQPLQRRVGAGEVLEVLGGGGQVGQRRQRHVAQEAVPLGDEVLVVELQHVVGERRRPRRRRSPGSRRRRPSGRAPAWAATSSQPRRAPRSWKPA